jgi:hypothetical protein
LTVTVSNQREVSELSVKLPSVSGAGEPGARVAVAATVVPARRAAVPAICGLGLVIMIEAAWVGLLLFAALRLLLR